MWPVTPPLLLCRLFEHRFAGRRACWSLVPMHIIDMVSFQVWKLHHPVLFSATPVGQVVLDIQAIWEQFPALTIYTKCAQSKPSKGSGGWTIDICDFFWLRRNYVWLHIWWEMNRQYYFGGKQTSSPRILNEALYWGRRRRRRNYLWIWLFASQHQSRKEWKGHAAHGSIYWINDSNVDMLLQRRHFY